MRFVVLAMGLAIVGYLTFRTMYGRSGVQGASAKERLDNVKGAARRIEADQQKQADEALKGATPQE